VDGFNAPVESGVRPESENSYGTSDNFSAPGRNGPLLRPVGVYLSKTAKIRVGKMLGIVEAHELRKADAAIAAQLLGPKEEPREMRSRFYTGGNSTTDPEGFAGASDFYCIRRKDAKPCESRILPEPRKIRSDNRPGSAVGHK
jgi:hypothetical protein